MLFGIIIGTYSSIFIAAPLLGYLGVKRDTVGAAREGQGAGAGDRAGERGRCRSRQGGSHGAAPRQPAMKLRVAALSGDAAPPKPIFPAAPPSTPTATAASASPT